MDLTRILDPLRDIPGVDDLGQAVDIPVVLDQMAGNVGIYVVPLAEAGGSTSFGDTACLQRIRIAIGLVICVRSQSDRVGAVAIPEIGTVRQAIKSRLIGLKPQAGIRELSFTAGALVNFDDRVLVWLDRYETELTERHLTSH